MNSIEIYTNRRNLIFILILNFIFLLLTVKMILFPKELSYSFIYNNKETIRVIGIVSTLFFAITFIFYLKKIFKKKIALIIDKNGVTDNLSPYKIGLIKWNNIENIQIESFHSKKLIVIRVKNPNDYLKKVGNFFLRYLMKKNIEVYNAPITISSNLLEYKTEELYDLIVKHWQFHKSSS